MYPEIPFLPIGRSTVYLVSRLKQVLDLGRPSTNADKWMPQLVREMAHAGAVDYLWYTVNLCQIPLAPN